MEHPSEGSTGGRRRPRPAPGGPWPQVAAAAEAGDDATLAALLDGGAPGVNPANTADTALYRCLAPRGEKHAGHVATARRLVGYGADLAASTPFQRYGPLRLAAAGGAAELVAALRELGAPAGLHDLAALYEVEALAAALDADPAAVEARDSEGRTPLMAIAASRLWRCSDAWAARSLEAARLLLARGADPSAPQQVEKAAAGRFTAVALWWAASWGHQAELAALLLAAGSTTASCVVAAAYHGDLPTLQLLLAHGAEVDERSPRGHTPLHDVLLFKRLELVEVLLEAGADPSAATPHGHTALHIAATVGLGADVLRRLVAAGARLDARDAEGRTPLNLAAQQGKGETVEALKALAVW